MCERKPGFEKKCAATTVSAGCQEQLLFYKHQKKGINQWQVGQRQLANATHMHQAGLQKLSSPGSHLTQRKTQKATTGSISMHRELQQAGASPHFLRCLLTRTHHIAACLCPLPCPPPAFPSSTHTHPKPDLPCTGLQSPAGCSSCCPPSGAAAGPEPPACCSLRYSSALPTPRAGWVR